MKTFAYSIVALFLFVFGLMLNRDTCFAASPTTTLSVSKPTLSTTAAPGGTAYLSSNVTYGATDIESYTLQVTYANGYSNLKLDGTNTALTGAGGKIGSSLADNSWGFAWTDNTTDNMSTNAGLTYYTVPSYGTSSSDLSTGRLEASSVDNILDSTTKRMVFAAKFASDNVNNGHYQTKVQLSMVATPKLATDLSSITAMQELDGHPEICTNTPLISGQKYSAEYTLKDTRDGKPYTVRKLGDGRCWMTENLKLKLTTAGLKQSDTDLNQGYDWDQTTRTGVVKPADTLTSISSGDGTFTGTQYKVGSYIASSSSAGETGYYSWNAATAGTGGTSSSDAIAANNQAPSSICPKGWTLPTGGTTGNTEFYNLFNSIKNSSGASIYENDTLKTSGYTNWKSPAADNLAVVQSSTDSSSKVIYNFKYTGYVSNGSLYNTSNGFWWSSTAYDANRAYSLRIYSSYVHPGTNDNDRYLGIAVRCIARDGSEEGA